MLIRPGKLPNSESTRLLHVVIKSHRRVYYLPFWDFRNNTVYRLGFCKSFRKISYLSESLAPSPFCRTMHLLPKQEARVSRESCIQHLRTEIQIKKHCYTGRSINKAAWQHLSEALKHARSTQLSHFWEFTVKEGLGEALRYTTGTLITTSSTIKTMATVRASINGTHPNKNTSIVSPYRGIAHSFEKDNMEINLLICKDTINNNPGGWKKVMNSGDHCSPIHKTCLLCIHECIF